jgi:hypothetical protein
LESLGWQMGLSHVVLTPFTGAYNAHGVCHCSRPVEALSKSVLDEGPRHGVVAVGIMMDVFKQLSPMLGGNTALQDLGVALFIEFSLDDDVRLSAVCKPSGLHPVDRECLLDEAVEIRDPLVWQGVRPCDGSSLISMTSGSGRATGSSAPEPEVGGSLPACFGSS